MKYLAVLIVLSSCAKFDGIRCFSIDGKAASWCKRKLRAQRVCKNKDGLKDYYYNWAKCGNGEEVRGIE